MEDSVPEDLGAPESWEAADLDETMRRLMLQDSKRDSKQHQHQQQQQPPPSELLDASVPGTSGSVLSSSGSGDKFSEDAINQVDQFLREALQNSRERLSILRMEQDVEKFIRDPSQQQLEFQQLPTSYLRLAAHRVAQHYSLQSMVLLDNSLPDGSGSKIIVRKTPECSKLPLIRLADIPASFPTEGGGVFKVAIKQRPQQQPQKGTNSSSNSSKTNSSKSVEERKEEYNRARARIFNSSNSTSGVIGKSDGEQRLQDGSLLGALGVSRIEEKLSSVISDATPSRFLIESSTSSDKLARTRTEKDPIGRGKSNNRVAIFRDHEVDRKDPDYDRSYDRYLQRFDPGFGFNSSPYAMQPMYTPALNYNTEFPQLGSSHRPLMSAERQSHPISQHLPGPWAAPSTPAGIGYSHPDTTIQPFNPNHVGTHSTSAIYLNPSPYPSQRPGITFIHPHAHLQPFTQSLQQSDANLGLARPR